MNDMGGKKWQNLIYGECPGCGSDLEKKELGLYKCVCCSFAISHTKYRMILEDESHIMRQFLGPEEYAFIDKILLTIV